MTISFSGPSSGIDTTAWVDALVKMKQASITSMETKKQTLEATTSILDNVKSFFASFKSVITNVTQANLGIASFDLFIQNLVETTNADIATASVTTEAQENNYELFVDQIATETQANSVFFTDITDTTSSIATHNSLLSSIGIGTGEVGFNVGGVERIITLQSNDTIKSFLDKLNMIGVDASYDATHGYFSINLGVEDINDDLDGDGIENTGIKNALYLTNVNSGYSSNLLELFSAEDLVIKATESAVMSAFGVTRGEYTLTDENGNETILCANIDGTFREFFDELENYGLYASFDEEGAIHIETTQGYTISGVLAHQLGIVVDDQSEKTDTKASSTVGVFSTEVNTAEYTSTLEEIGAMVNDNDKLQVLDVNNNLIAEINTLTKGSTVDDLFNALAQYGVAGTLDNNVISFESPLGYIIGGEIAENMGIETVQTSTTTIKTGESTTSTGMISYLASATDWVSDCLWDVWDSYSAQDKVLTVTHTDRYGTDQTYYYTVVAKNSIAADGSVLKGTQFEDIANWYHSLDPTSTFVFNDQGQIFVDSDDCFYFEGKIAEYLGIGGYVNTYTWTQGVTTTTSSATISYRVRKTDYIADTLWDNGWNNYSAADKVISAYSITVDHTAGVNSVNHPDFGGTSNAEGNYTETNATYQHTIKTLVGTFTIKAGESTYEDLGYWFTHDIDRTAAFTINNDGTLSIDSDNTFIMEGRAITDLGLGISTIAQSWTTGLEETQSTASVTYAAKMTDYISDTFTSSQWNGVNKVISVYSNNVDHTNGGDGNSVYQVTIQTKLTDITITTSTTFNDLRDALAPYNITLSMTNGVITLDSSKANYLVEDVFNNISIQNGVTVLQARTTSTNGTTSMLNHFGITFDTVTQTWTTGTAATQSTGTVNYIVKLTDYISDTFTSSQWANLAAYKDSAGNNHAGNVIAVMHSYVDHTNQKTIIETKTCITVTTDTTFKNLQKTLSNLKSGDPRNEIKMDIVDGVITLDSNCCWIEGTIPNAYGIKTDQVTMNWTTGTAATQSTGVVQFNSSMTDYITDTFTASAWSSLAKYTDGAGVQHNGNVIAIMHAEVNHSTQKTVITNTTNITINSDTTFNNLASALSTYGISLTIANGVVKLDSSRVSGMNNSAYYIEGKIPEHWGVKFDTATQNWTTGTATTQSTAVINYNAKMTDYISDIFTQTNWNSLANYTDNSGTAHAGNVIAIMHEYLDHSTHTVKYQNSANITITTGTTFQNLADSLKNYGITLGISNGAVTMSSSLKDGLSYYVQGRIPDFFGVSTSSQAQTWTYGSDSTSSQNIAFKAVMTDYISDTFTQTAWNNLGTYNVETTSTASNGRQSKSTTKVAGTVITVMRDTLNHTHHTVDTSIQGYITITTNTTFDSLRSSLLNYGITLSISGTGVLQLDNQSGYATSGYTNYVVGSIANYFGVKSDTTTQNWTTGTENTKSSGAVAYNADNDDYIKNMFTTSGWNNLNKVLTVYNMDYDYSTHKTVTNTKGTITIADSWTLATLNSALASFGISCSVAGGKVTLDSSNGNWVEGALATHMGLTYNTISLTCTYGVAVTSSAVITNTINASDTIWDYLYGSWNSLNKSIVVKQDVVNYSTGNVQTNAIKTFNIDATTTFSGLASLLASNSSNNISMSITNGKISLSGSNNYFATGDIITKIGGSTTTTTKALTYASSQTSGSALSYSGVVMADKVSDVVGIGNNTALYVVQQYWNFDNKSASYVTVKTISTSGTFSDISSALSSYGMSLSASGNKLTLSSSNENYYVTGSLATYMGWGISTTTIQQTVGKSYTGTALTATAVGGSKMTQFGFAVSDQVLIKYFNSLTGVVESDLVACVAVGNHTFDSFAQALNNINGVTASFKNGKLKIDVDRINYRIGVAGSKFQLAGGYNKTTTTYTESTNALSGELKYKTTTVTTSSSTGIKGKTSYSNGTFDSSIAHTLKVSTSKGSFTYTFSATTSMGVICDVMDANGKGLHFKRIDNKNCYAYAEDGVTVNTCSLSGIGLSNNGSSYYQTATITTTTTTTTTKTMDSTAWSSVKITDLGFKAGNIYLIQYYVDRSKNVAFCGRSATINVAATDTLASVKNKLSSYGVQFELVGSKLHWQSSGGKDGKWVFNGTDAVFGSQGGTAGTRDVYTKEGVESMYKYTMTANGSSRLDEVMGYGPNNIFRVQTSSGVKGDFSYDGNNTINDVLKELNNYGLGASISGGKITISSSGANYISSLSSDASKLGLSTSASAYQQSKGWTRYKTSGASKGLTTYITANNYSNATLSAMGYSAQTFVKYTHNNGANPGSVASTNISWAANESLATFMQRLRDNGFTVSLSGSKITITSNSGYSYYLGGVGANNPLGLGTGYTSKNVTMTQATQTGSVLYHTMHSATTLGDLGLGNQVITITKHVNGDYAQDCTTTNGHKITGTTSNFSLTWTTSQTLAQFAAAFNADANVKSCGMSITYNDAGKMTISGSNNAYVSSLSDGLKNTIKLNGATTTTSTYSLKCEAESNKTGLLTYLNENTRLSDFGYTANQTFTIVKHNNNNFVTNYASGSTTTYVLTWKTTDTLATFANTLKSYGITLSANAADRTLNFNGGEYYYVHDISDALENTMRISTKTSGTYGTSYGYTIKYRANADNNAEYTYLNERNSKLFNLGLTSAQTLTFVLHKNNTYVANTTHATNCTKTVTYTWGTNQTLAEFEKAVNDALAAEFKSIGSPNGLAGNYNVTFSVDKNSGKWRIQTGENLYLSDVSQGLKDKTKIAASNKTYNYSIRYSNAADTVAEKTYLNERNTKLHNMGITSNQTMTLVVHNNNTFAQNQTDGSNSVSNVTRTITVTWTTDETLSQFEKKVNDALLNTYNGVGKDNNIASVSNTFTSKSGTTTSTTAYNSAYYIKFDVDANSGKWSFTGNEFTYVSDISSSLASFMKVNKQSNGTYGKSYQYSINYRADADGTVDKTYVNIRNTKLSNITISTAQTMDIVYHVNNTFAVNNTDAAGGGTSMSKISNVTKTLTVTWTTSQTLSQFQKAVNDALKTAYNSDGSPNGIPSQQYSLYMETIAANGTTKTTTQSYTTGYFIDFSVDKETGKWKFVGNEYCYVNRIDSALESYMKLTGDKKEGGTYGKSYQYTINYRADADKNKEYTYLNIRNTKLDNMSITSNQTMTFVVHNNNTFAQNQTDGLDSATDVTKTITVTWKTSETLSQFQKKVNDTLLSAYQSYGIPNNIASINNSLYMETVSSNGTTTTFNQAYTSGYYVDFTVDKNTGKLKILGNEYTYLKSVSSELENYLKLTGDKKQDGTYGRSYNYTINYRADADKNTNGQNPNAIEYTYLNERNTTLNNLSYVNASGQTISTTQSQTMDIVIHINNTYAQDNTKSAIQQKVRSSGSTYYVTTTSGLTETSSSAVTYYTTVVAGTSNTFAELGINTSSPIEVFDGNQNKLGEFTMQSTSTLQDFFTAVKNINPNAQISISNSGRITLTNGYLTGSVASALGLNMEYCGDRTIALTQTSASSITYDQTVHVDTTTALADIGYNISAPTEVFDKYGEKLGEFTLSSSATIGDFISSVNALSGENNATLTNGVISLKSGYVAGALASQLGMSKKDASVEASVFALTTSSTEDIHYTTTVNATETSSFDNLGFHSGSSTNVFDQYGKKVGEFSLSTSATVGEFIASINAFTTEGNATIKDGVVSIKNGYITGSFADQFGLGYNISKDYYTAAVTTSSSEAVYNRTTENATATSTFKDLGIDTSSKITLCDKYGNEVTELEVTQNSSLQDLVNLINTATYTDGTSVNAGATINGNKITIANGYIEGTIATELGMNPTQTGTETKTIGKDATSSEAVVYYTHVNADADTTFGEMNINTDQAVTVYNEYGTAIGTFTMGQTSTLSDFVNAINNSSVYNSNAQLNGNIISIEKGFVTGDIATALGLTQHNADKTVNLAKAISSTIAITCTNGATATENTQMSELGQTGNNYKMTMYNSTTEGYVTFVISTTTTIGNIKQALIDNGISASFENGILTIGNDGDTSYLFGMTGNVQKELQINNKVGSNKTFYSTTVAVSVTDAATVYKSTEMHHIDENTTFGDLGLPSDKDSYIETNRGNINITSTDTVISSFKNAFQNADGSYSGFDVTVDSNGYVTIAGNDDLYIEKERNITPRVLEDLLHIKPGENSTNESVTRALYGSTSSCLKVVKDNLIDENTTFYDIGLNNTSVLQVYETNSNNVNNITIQRTEKIFDALDRAGFNVTVNSDGTVSLTSKDGMHYIKADNNLTQALKLSIGEGNSYQTVEYDKYNSTSSDQQQVLTTRELDANTRLSDIGIGNCTIVTNSGTISIKSTNTILDKLALLNDAGFNVTFNNNKITIESVADGAYIKSMSPELSNLLKVNIGEGMSYRTVDYNTYSGTESKQLDILTTKTLDANTKLKDFGLGSCTIVLNNTSIKIDANESIVSRLNVLNSKGFNVTYNDGKVTIESLGDSYIKDMTPELAALLNISVGEGNTYETQHPYRSSGSNYLKATLSQEINETTTLRNLGISENVTIATNRTVVTITTADTVMSKLREAGIGVSVVNGKVSLSGNETNYVMSMSNILKSKLKVDVGENQTWARYVDERISDGDIDKVTRTITVTWTYGTLGTEDEQAKPETLAQFINVINNSLAAATTQYKSMFNLSEDFNISAYVDGNGKLHFTGDEYTYVSRIDDFLANALKVKSVTKEGGTYGKSYNYTVQYANNSNNKTQYTYTNYDNMRLQNFDVTQDQYITIVTHNNTTFVADSTNDQIGKNSTITHENTTSTYVITWTVGTTGHTKQGNGYNNTNNAITDGETFEELKYELEHFGEINGLATEASAVLGNGIYKINVTINADRTISLVGNEYTYILGISDELQDKFKIQGREGEGYYYNKYDYSIRFNNDGYTDNVNTTLLNYDTRLDNLSIMADMTMTIETPDGGKSIVFDHDTTMQEIKERLFSDYGIEVSIEDKTGRITFTPTLIDEGYYILGMDTELKNGLKLITGEKGTYTLDSEQIIATNKAGVYTTTTYRNVTTTGGTYETSTINNYDNTASRNLRFEDDDNIIKLSTRISRLNGYDNGNGKITVHYADGLEQNISIRESMTVGQLCEILQDYGVTAEILAGGRVTFKSNDGTYVKSAEGGSNLLEVLNMSDVSIKTEGTTVITSKTLERTEQKEVKYLATEETLLSTYAEGLLEANGVITFALNDKYKSVTITSDDTFGTLIQKFKEKGINAKIEAGKFSLSSGFDTFSIIQGATTSNLSAIIQLNEKIDLGGYAMTDRSKTIMSTTTITDTRTMSVVNFADDNTKLSTFNIIGGTLSLYVDGKKAGIQVSSTDTIKSLQDKFRSALGQDVNGSDEENLTLTFEDGYLKIRQNGANLIVGSNEDTSNFAAITGIYSNNGIAESSRHFYKANEYTRVVESGIFRNGDVTVGDFVIGDATITIDETTTLGELASQINTNPDSNVTAYWDSIDGEFKIKSNNTGNFYINFEAGSSNFTDILGFTKTSQDLETGTVTTSINTDVQKQGKNARVRINGASYTSVSNTLGSDVTSIKGLTINLKGMSAGEATILSVKKDVQSLALAISDVVDAYNALIDNINTALSSKSELQNDSELKRLRNQIKSIMTGTNKNSSIFKNIVSIGIVTNTADPTNLSVGSGIYKLSLDYEKFAKAFEADSDSVRTLLIGRVDSEGNVIEEGILTRLEALIDEAVDTAGGYFERTEESFDRQITRLDNKIAKGNDAIEKYRERLEKKYMSMNILNSNIQTQYQVYFN